MTKVEAVDDEWDKFSNFEAYDNFTHSWLSACRRILKDTGAIWVIGSYHNIYRVGKILQDLGFWILNDIIWVKTNPMPNFRGVRFTNAHETLIWAQKIKGQKYTFNYHTMKTLNDGKQMRSDWDIPESNSEIPTTNWKIPIASGRERIKVDNQTLHPTQKPEALLYKIIQSTSKPGDIVLDPFFGSGTTGAIAKKLHRNWIGIENDINYINAASQRIQSIKETPFDESIYKTKPRNQQFKIPFGNLLTLGLIVPGEKLYLDKTDFQATVLSDGNILSGELEGSIHNVASTLLGARCNGWVNWKYLDRSDSQIKTIDNLRKQAEKIILPSKNLEVNNEKR
jgi:modification methylase